MKTDLKSKNRHAPSVPRRPDTTALRASEIRYRRLFETAHDGVLLLNPETRKIVDSNPFMTRLLGYSHKQLVGKELFEIGLLKDEVASRRMFQKLKHRHEVRYENLPLETQRGRHQEVEVVANLYLEAGRPIIQCNIRDITERKLAEQALRSSEARFRILFEMGPVAVYSCDASGVIQNFNNRAVELWGRRPVRGMTEKRFCGAFKLFRPNGQPMSHEHCPMADVLRGKISKARDQEVVLERPDGTRLTCVVNITPLKNERGDVTGAINCFYDITERKTAQEVQHRLEALAASNQELVLEIAQRKVVEAALKTSEHHYSQLLKKSQILQDQLRQLSRQILRAQEEERKKISRELHDVIAQTLTGINIRLAALKTEANSSTTDLQEKIASTQQLVEHSVNIVHQFARELRPAVLDDLGLIPALHTFLKNFTTQTGIRSKLTAFAGVEALDTAKRTVLYRVAQEALTNVARHAKASRVEVNIVQCAKFVCMTVADDGRSFKVVGALHSRNGKHLGLLGMRERVEMVEGTFCVDSEPGKGTTIRVEIPVDKLPKGTGKKSGNATLKCP